MRPNSVDSEKLLLLTLTLESAVTTDDWAAVTQMINARAELLDDLGTIPESILAEIRASEERMLTHLRKGLVGVRADLRNLSAALKIASPYSKEQSPSSLSLAG